MSIHQPYCRRQAIEALSHHLLHDLTLSQVQLDELWALLGLREGHLADLARRARSSW